LTANITRPSAVIVVADEGKTVTGNTSNDNFLGVIVFVRSRRQ
jgi:hypothetical protein